MVLMANAEIQTRIGLTSPGVVGKGAGQRRLRIGHQGADFRTTARSRVKAGLGQGRTVMSLTGFMSTVVHGPAEA